MAYRTRPEPKTPRRAVLAGAPKPVVEQEPAAGKPKKRTTRKRAPKAEKTDE